MRFMTGAATLALMLAMGSSAQAADDWYRLNLRAPILFSGGSVLPPDAGGNADISITIDETALINGSARGRQYGDLSVPVTISGTDASHTVSLEGLSGAIWVPTGSAYGSGTVSWHGAAEGAWSPTIVVKDADDNIVATAQLDLEILPPLTASVPQSSYNVDKGDDLTIQASAGNAIGDVLWGSDDVLPEWIDLDALTGELEVDTSASNSASGLKLTAVDQFDNMSATTLPFSVTVNGASIITGTDGSIYVVGDTTSAGAGSSDLFVAKYSVTGALEWKNTLGGGSLDYGSGVSVGSDGSVYVTGYTAIGTGSYDLLVAKYTANGALAWKKKLGGARDDQGFGIVVGADDAVYVSGATSSASGVYTNPKILIAKYSNEGSLSFIKTLGGSSFDSGAGITVDNDGSIYVTGRALYTGAGGGYDILVAKYSSAGSLAWKKTLGGADYDAGYSVIVDSYGAVYIAGSTARIGAGDNDLLVAKYSANGVLDWAKTLSGLKDDQASGIAVGADGAIHVIGYTTISSARGNDLLVARLPGNGGADMTAGSFIWQDAVLTEGDGGTLSETSPNWDSPDAVLADNPDPTGLTEGDAAALTGDTIQFEK